LRKALAAQPAHTNRSGALKFQKWRARPPRSSMFIDLRFGRSSAASFRQFELAVFSGAGSQGDDENRLRRVELSGRNRGKISPGGMSIAN
jgi:hypothetical protein